MAGLTTPGKLRRQFPLWLKEGLSWMVVGMLAGWALTSLVWKLTEAEYRDVIEEAQRNAVRVLKQGGLPAAR